MILRYLFGLTGSAVTRDAIGPASIRTSPTEIVRFLDSIKLALDVDGDSKPDALTDGLMVLRYTFGIRGPALTASSIGTGATRTPAEIEAYIKLMTP